MHAPEPNAAHRCVLVGSHRVVLLIFFYEAELGIA